MSLKYITNFMPTLIMLQIKITNNEYEKLQVMKTWSDEIKCIMYPLYYILYEQSIHIDRYACRPVVLLSTLLFYAYAGHRRMKRTQ